MPSSQVSTEAKPGVKPAPWETASTTGDPHRRSISARICGGRCGHSSRRAVRPWGMVVGSAYVGHAANPSLRFGHAWPDIERERDLDRFLTFIDAIVAIAITLLVLPLVELTADIDEYDSVARPARDHQAADLGVPAQLRRHRRGSGSSSTSGPARARATTAGSRSC